MDDEQFWTSTRHWTHFEDRKYFDLLIDRMEALRDQTEPAKGDASAKGKDLAAFQALRHAADLVTALVGWAIAHQVGLAAEGLSFVPLGPAGEFRTLPQHQQAKEAVDAHRHELRGDQLIRGRLRVSTDPKTGRESVATSPPIDPLVARHAIINLLHAGFGGMPHEIADSLRDALLALDMNEVRPILQAQAQGRKIGLDMQRLELQAVCFWKFRQATGLYSAMAAQERVAEAYGVEVETLRGWEKRLRDELGQLKVSRDTNFAKNAASYVKAEKSRGKANSDLEEHERYGDMALDAAAAAFRSLRAG